MPFTFLPLAGRVRLVGLLVAFGMVLAGCATREVPAEATSTPGIQPTREPYILIIPLGQPATNDEAMITINGVRRSTEEAHEVLENDLEWLLIDMSVRNLAAAPFQLSARLIHPDGTHYERAYPPTATPELEEFLHSGIEVQGEIAFLITRDTFGPILIYGPGQEIWALELGMIPDQP